MEDLTFLLPPQAPGELLHQEEEAAFRQNLVPVDQTFLFPFQALGVALEVEVQQGQAVPEACHLEDHILQEQVGREAYHPEDHILQAQGVLEAFHRGELGACHHREDQVLPAVPFLLQEGRQNLVVCYRTAKVSVSMYIPKNWHQLSVYRMTYLHKISITVSSSIELSAVFNEVPEESCFQCHVTFTNNLNLRCYSRQCGIRFFMKRFNDAIEPRSQIISILAQCDLSWIDMIKTFHTK